MYTPEVFPTSPLKAMVAGLEDDPYGFRIWVGFGDYSGAFAVKLWGGVTNLTEKVIQINLLLAKLSDRFAEPSTYFVVEKNLRSKYHGWSTYHPQK